MSRKAEAGDKVHVHYTGKLDDGEMFDSSRSRQPLDFRLGAGEVIPGLERAVAGMEVGTSREVRLEPEEAYGQPREDLVIDVPLDRLPEGERPAVGDTLRLQDSQGRQHMARVADMGQEQVTLDLNHPLAGKALTFELELVEVE